MALPRKLRLPEPGYRALETLLRLSPTQFDELERVLLRLPPTLRPLDFAANVAAAVGGDERNLAEVVYLLTQLYVARGSFGLTIAEIVDQVCEAMQQAGKETPVPDDGDWVPFRERLTRLLGIDQTLGVTSKAIDVMMQHEHTYCTSRVLTDLRPVFRTDPAESPEAAIIIHTLKITYHRGDRTEEFFVALDGADLEELREQLTRAAQKAISLRNIMKSANLADLESEKE
jgi:hypothetical protein